MLKLTHLRIRRFRSVEPDTELNFGPTFNVLLGKNAAGKTTLLDLIASILDDNLSRYIDEEGEGFDLEYTASFKGYILRVVSTYDPQPRANPGPLDKLGIALPLIRSWSLNILKESHTEPVFQCTVQGNRGQWERRPGGSQSFEIESTGDSTWSVADALIKGVIQNSSEPDELALVTLQLVFAKFFYDAARFDEALGAFNTLDVAATRIRTLGPRLCQFVPLKIANELGERLKSDSEEHAQRFDFTELPELSRVLPILGFVRGEFTLALEKRSSDGGEVTHHYRGVSTLLERPTGDLINGALLSFGQKRLLAFYWYLAVRAELPVVADELANGLHHEWIEACMAELSQRQSFIASQNPLLLDHLPLSDGETTLVHCSKISMRDREAMRWRNFGVDEMDRVKEACAVGIQHISEILRSEGLW